MRPWPVGVLAENIEVQFMHYESNEVARAAWYRRLSRIPVESSRVFFKFDDRDLAGQELLEEFSSLPLKNKVLFVSSRNYSSGRILIPTASGDLPDGLELSRISRLYFDAAAWIAGRKQRPGTAMAPV